ncbi:MAG: hypothetical protein C0424_03835 [Sphingobacteriaceae bacterium]|nr:hypothetical protein [Sphingobacteriaceae bacterium]
MQLPDALILIKIKSAFYDFTYALKWPKMPYYQLQHYFDVMGRHQASELAYIGRRRLHPYCLPLTDLAWGMYAVMESNKANSYFAIVVRL